MDGRLVVLGARSRVGRLLAQAWADRPDVLWVSRHGANAWSAEAGPAQLVPHLAEARAVFVLAGATKPEHGLGLNTEVAKAATIAAPPSAHLFLASSQVVYGTSPGPHHEGGQVAPASAYAASKLKMEAAFADHPRVTSLRIGNVLGADVLGCNIAAGAALTIDQFADGRTPRRSYIDPVSLGIAVDGLLQAAEAGRALPKVVNIARAPVLEMGEIAQASGMGYTARPAAPDAVPEVAMDLTRLFDLVPALAAPWPVAQAVAAWQGMPSQ
ncbi:MAG: NAD-dependent epimerase/dehydratase family protein [Pseudomonadota bacterium]